MKNDNRPTCKPCGRKLDLCNRFPAQNEDGTVTMMCRACCINTGNWNNRPSRVTNF